jgi:ribosome-associated protein
VISTADHVLNNNTAADRRAASPATPATSHEDTACAVARLLTDHRCDNPVVLDIGAVSDVADYFVIATVRSSTHLAGVYGHLMQYCKERGIEPLGGSKRVPNNPWLLVDLGPVVVHLMERETREFYELEKLWFNGRLVFGQPDDDRI